VFFSDFFVHFDWSKSKDEAGFADGFTSDELFIPGTAKSEKLPVFYMSCSFALMFSINIIFIYSTGGVWWKYSSKSDSDVFAKNSPSYSLLSS